ncbi:MAG: DUF2950 family protein, partial [Chromatiales bacterium]
MNKINAHKSFLSPAWAVLALIMLLSSAVFAQQSHFETADQAADAFVIAVATNDEAALTGLLGEGYRDVLPVEELDAEQLQRFVDAWIHYHSLVSNDVKTRMLAVGVNGWTLPIPIVKDAEGWRFDLVEGEEVMRLRRVG